MESKVELLQKKTQHKVAQLRRTLLNKYRNECLALFSEPGMRDLPLVSLYDALNRTFVGENAVLVNKKANSEVDKAIQESEKCKENVNVIKIKTQRNKGPRKVEHKVYGDV